MTTTLDNWRVIVRTTGPGAATDQTYQVHGQPAGAIPGSAMLTSSIVAIVEVDVLVAEDGSRYRLGTEEVMSAAFCPGERERLFAAVEAQIPGS